MGFVATAFLFVLQMQVLQMIRTDAYALSTTRIELLGFAVAHTLGALLVGQMIASRRIMSAPLFTALVLTLYITLVAAFTKPSLSLLAMLLSRHGFFNWFLLGLGMAGMADIFHITRWRGLASGVRRAAVASFIVVALMTLSFALNYLKSPYNITNYQAMSYGVMILTITAFIAINALWKHRAPVVLLMSVIGVGSLLVAATALANSTIIVAYWCAFLVIFLLSKIVELPAHSKFVLAVATVAFLAALSQSQIVADIITLTRFREFSQSDFVSFSSIDTRTAILPSFQAQFAISPIFGNYNAEVISGNGEGYYVHSLPLAFLTHTGLLGFLLMLITLQLVMRQRFSARNVDRAELQSGRLMAAIIILGTLATFLTWPVFWFMLGFLCKRPSPRA